MSLCMARWHWVQVYMLIRRSNGVVASFSGRRHQPRRRGGCAVIPSGKPTSSERFPAQPPLQWAPPPAMGLTPGLRSPTARCYAGADVCPLAQPEHVGASAHAAQRPALRKGGH